MVLAKPSRDREGTYSRFPVISNCPLPHSRGSERSSLNTHNALGVDGQVRNKHVAWLVR